MNCMNTLKIKARCVELGMTQEEVARKLGIKSATFSQKINNIRKTGVDEAFALAEILQIPDEQFRAYFFAN